MILMNQLKLSNQKSSICPNTIGFYVKHGCNFNLCSGSEKAMRVRENTRLSFTLADIL